jgi:hypothetical protein
MDLGIGDIFNCRVAGNAANEDILGSMEFACKLAGAKVVLVMGHTACGAIKGAIDNAQLGNLTGLLAKIQPAVGATTYTGERSASNYSLIRSEQATLNRNSQFPVLPPNLQDIQLVLPIVKSRGLNGSTRTREGFGLDGASSRDVGVALTLCRGHFNNIAAGAEQLLKCAPVQTSPAYLYA